jgi:hypothetical protein
MHRDNFIFLLFKSRVAKLLNWPSANFDFRQGQGFFTLPHATLVLINQGVGTANISLEQEAGHSPPSGTAV